MPTASLIIVPTFNEADNLEGLLSAVRRALPEADILVVDDASADGTGRIADEASRADAQVHVLHRPAKLGLGGRFFIVVLPEMSTVLSATTFDGDGEVLEVIETGLTP